MSDRTCSVDGCGRPHSARGVCHKHYMAARNAGTLDQLVRLPQHRLTEVDIETATGKCSICGPVKVVGLTHSFAGNRKCWNVHQEANLRRRGRDRGEEKSRAGEWAKLPAEVRHVDRLRKKGLTVPEFDRMMAAQNGKCAICERDGYLVIDHNHATGVVRGLLCQTCNLGIGLLGDSASRVMTAALYLSAFRSAVAGAIDGR